LLNWARLRFRPSRLGHGLWPASSPHTPFGPWPPGRLGPARPSPSPSLTSGPHPFVFLVRPLSHEAGATGRPSAAGSPFGCPVELLPLPVIDTLPHLLSPLWLRTSLAPSRPKRPAIKPSTIHPIKATGSTPRQHRPSSLPPSPLS
jgi:hypothetical protein